MTVFQIPNVLACPGQGCLSVTPTGVLAHIIPQVSSAPKEQPENAISRKQ